MSNTAQEKYYEEQAKNLKINRIILIIFLVIVACILFFICARIGVVLYIIKEFFSGWSIYSPTPVNIEDSGQPMFTPTLKFSTLTPLPTANY